jgi:hypothetical protein
MVRFLFAAAFAALATSPALAQTAADAALAAGIAPKEKVICKVEQPVGSRLGGRKVCRTVSEATDIRDQTRQKMDLTQRFYTNGS